MKPISVPHNFHTDNKLVVIHYNKETNLSRYENVRDYILWETKLDRHKIVIIHS